MDMTYAQLRAAFKANYGWGEKRILSYIESIGKTVDDTFTDEDYTNAINNYYTSKGFNGHGRSGLTDVKWR